MWYYIQAFERSAYAPVAQLDRVTDYESVGRGFESLLAYQRGVLIGLPFELFVNIFQKLHVGVQLFSVLKLWIEGLFPYYNIRRFL